MVDSFQSMRFEVAIQDLEYVDEINRIALDEQCGWLGNGQEGELYQIYCLPALFLGQSGWACLACLCILIVL